MQQRLRPRAGLCPIRRRSSDGDAIRLKNFLGYIDIFHVSFAVAIRSKTLYARSSGARLPEIAAMCGSSQSQQKIFTHRATGAGCRAWARNRGSLPLPNSGLRLRLAKGFISDPDCHAHRRRERFR